MTARILLILITLISALVAFFIGLIVVLSGFRKDLRRLSFAIFAFSISLWITAGQLTPILLTKVHYATLVNIIGQSTINIAALCFAFFIFAYLKSTTFIKKFLIFIVILFPLAELVLILTKSISGVFIDQSTGFLSYDLNLKVYPFIVLYPLIAALTPVILLLKYSSINKQNNDYLINRKLARSSFIFILGALISTYIIPIYIYDNLLLEFSLFNLFSIIFLYSLGRQIFGDKIVDLRHNGWRSALRFLIQFVSLASFSLLSYVLPSELPTKGIHTAVEHILAGVLALFGWFLGKKIALHFLKQYETSLIEFNKSLQILRTELDTVKLSRMFANIIIKNLEAEKILVLSYNNSAKLTESDIVVVTKEDLKKDNIKPYSESNLRRFNKLLSDNKVSNTLKQFEREELKELELNEYYYGVAFKNRDISIVVLASEKTDGEEYGVNDLAILNAAVSEFTLVIQNAQQYTRIRKFNEELEQKIADATRQLRKTNDKLKELDAAKDEFISMASHQLRTPLTSVKGYLSMVLEGDAGNITKQQKLMLDQAFTSSQRMVYLIADFLNVSRLKTGKFIIEPKPTFLPDLVAGELDQLYTTAKGKNLELSFNKPKQFPSLNLDETKTRQVVMNFVDNALHYTPEGGHVKVALEATEHAVNFTVSDDGIGVPRSDQRHLFSKFYRAGNARKARPDGTGLGLYMAKKVIIAEGGAIIANSQEGKGSTFGFTFPRARLEIPVITKHVKSKTSHELTL